MFELQGEGENRTIFSYYNYEIFLIESSDWYTTTVQWGWRGGGEVQMSEKMQRGQICVGGVGELEWVF